METITTENRYAQLVEFFIADSDVAHESSGKNVFGSGSLKVNNKIFAMLVKGHLVVKLPRQRVDDLIESGEGQNFDPGHGRPMKEWLTLSPTANEDWLELAQEAKRYVATKG